MISVIQGNRISVPEKSEEEGDTWCILSMGKLSMGEVKNIVRVRGGWHNGEHHMIHDTVWCKKYQTLILSIFTTSDYNKFAAEIVIANRKENSLVDNISAFKSL